MWRFHHGAVPALAVPWDPKTLCTEITPVRPSVWAHTKLSPFLVTCSLIASLHCGFKHKKVSFPAESPAESRSRASRNSGLRRVPSPPLSAQPFPCSRPAGPITPTSSFVFCFHPGTSPLADLPLHLSHSPPPAPPALAPSTRAFPRHTLCHHQHGHCESHLTSAFLPLLSDKKEESWPEKKTKSKATSTLVKRSQCYRESFCLQLESCSPASKAVKEAEVNRDGEG